MSAAPSSFLIASEIPLLLTLGLGGLGLIRFAGVRSPSLLTGLALLGTSAISLGVIPFTLVLGSSALIPTLALCILSFAAAVVRYLDDHFFWRGTLGLSSIVLVAWGLKHLFQLRERVGEDAVSVLLQAVLKFQDGLGFVDSRRGFSYPLLMSLSQDGSILASMTPLIGLSLLAAVFGYGRELTKSSAGARMSDLLPMLLAIGLVGSAPIFVVSLGYANSHLLMALAICAAVGSVLVAIRTLSISRQNVALIWVASLVGATARFEGAILVLAVLIQLLIFFDLGQAKQRKMVRLALAAPLVGFLYWMPFTDIRERLLETAFIIIFLALVPSLTFFKKTLANVPVGILLPRAIWIALVVVPLTLMVLKYPGQSIVLFQSIAQNFVIGVSGWGAVIPATLLGSALLYRGRKNRVELSTFRVWWWGVLITLSLKLMDSLPANVGFNESLVRTLLHWLGPLMIYWILMILRTPISYRNDLDKVSVNPESF